MIDNMSYMSCLFVVIQVVALAAEPTFEQVRTKVAEARAALTAGRAQLTSQDATLLDMRLTDVEKALESYRKLKERGQARANAMAPLAMAGGTMVADDVTGVGAANDVLLPFVAIAALVAYWSTASSASNEELNVAWQKVLAALAALAEAVDQVTVFPRSKDGTCYCKCANKNDGPHLRGRMTPAECASVCARDGFSVTICK